MGLECWRWDVEVEAVEKLKDKRPLLTGATFPMRQVLRYSA